MKEKIQTNAQDGHVEVKVDYSKVELVSKLQLGITPTHKFLDNYGREDANSEAARLLTQATKLLACHAGANRTTLCSAASPSFFLPLTPDKRRAHDSCHQYLPYNSYFSC